jgi:TolB-like protein/Flp pilus assembly protein TadD
MQQREILQIVPHRLYSLLKPLAVTNMPSSPRILRFGVFEADLETGELRKQGLRLRLPHQVFEVLAMMLHRPGEIVTRDEFRTHLWPGNTFVDFDHGLNKAINRLRCTLNDSASSPRFVETIARKGYRLIVPVSAKEELRPKSEVVARIRLAVLPFENLSADPDQDFFSDGLTEEMISQLGRLSPARLGVIARTSAMRYKRTDKRIDQIGEELNLDYILEGSVRRAENRIRITAQLIQVADQTHLWAESYNRELADIFQVQHEVAHRVASSLAFELLPESAAQQVTPEAYDAYLHGKFYWNKGTDTEAWKAVECFRDAIRLYPGYSLAYSATADCYGRLAWYGSLNPQEAAKKAEKAALRALQADDQSGEAHCSLALVRFWFDWNWIEAEKEFKTALALKPNYAAAHNWYAAYLNVMGRFEEAAIEHGTAEEWDPLSLVIAMNRADPYYFSHRFPQAVKIFEDLLRREPGFFPAEYNLARLYAQCGRVQEALASFRHVRQVSGVRQADAAVAYACALAGQNDEARQIQTALREFASSAYLPAPQLAMIAIGFGELDAAVRYLQQGLEERSCLMIYLKADPLYDPLRSHPGFLSIIKHMNFPP